VLTSATKKVDVAVFSTISAAQKAGSKFRTGYDAIFSVKNGGVGYGKISSRVSAKLKTEVANIQKQIASGKIVVRRQSPPATTG
jgi:basic membrane lipoprotein Med (substrate-binding protein (PBP1-ABC) superfamily)